MDEKFNIEEKEALTPSRRIYDFSGEAEEKNREAEVGIPKEEADGFKKLLEIMQGDEETAASTEASDAHSELYDAESEAEERKTTDDDVDFTPLGRKKETALTVSENEDVESEICDGENEGAEDTLTENSKEDPASGGTAEKETADESAANDADIEADIEAESTEGTLDDESRHIFRFAGERRDGILHIEGTTLEAKPRNTKKSDGDTHAGEELARDYSKSQVRKIVRARMRTDLAYVRAAHNDKLRTLEFEYRTASLVFSKRKKKRGMRTEGEIRSEMNKIDHALKKALRREKADNKRYYKPLRDDYVTQKLPNGASRENLAQLRDELFKLLAKRDEINMKLISLYSGGELDASGGYSALINAELYGKRTAYNKQKKIDSLIYKHHVSVSHSKKLYALMDEYVELSGKISKIDFKLKREHPHGSDRRSLRRERRRLKRKRSDVDGDIKHNMKLSVEAAIARRRAKIYTIAGFSLLIALVALGLFLWANGQSILDHLVSLAGR